GGDGRAGENVAVPHPPHAARLRGRERPRARGARDAEHRQRDPKEPPLAGHHIPPPAARADSPWRSGSLPGDAAAALRIALAPPARIGGNRRAADKSLIWLIFRGRSGRSGEGSRLVAYAERLHPEEQDEVPVPGLRGREEAQRPVAERVGRAPGRDPRLCRDLAEERSPDPHQCPAERPNGRDREDPR